MIRISSVKCIPEELYDRNGKLNKAYLHNKIAKLIGQKPEQIKELRIIRRSLDARKKPELYYILTVDVSLTQISDEQFLKRNKKDFCAKAKDPQYSFPVLGKEKLKERPVIVGMGPCGLFCAYMLALNGYKPLLLERGKKVEDRTEDVRKFWETGVLNPSSNVQFGEGGAGTFSDGKLNTVVKDKFGRNHKVLSIFCEHGAKEEIQYDYKPHIGTDELVKVIRSMRELILEKGGEIRFNSEVSDLCIENNSVKKLIVNHSEEIPVSVVVFAIGHSARDTFEMLFQRKLLMEAKAFAVGFRVEHSQDFINQSQYGKPASGILGAAPYKLTAQTKSGRGVYSFCMCPGGYVVNASSEENCLAVNGMSYSGRDGANSNSAIIVSVTPSDYPSDHPLAGIAFQRELEKKAYEIGNGEVPVERYEDFKKDILKENYSETPESDRIEPCIKGRYRYAKVSEILPGELNEAFVEGMDSFNRYIKGYAGTNVLLEGVESRTSSPVRILRDDNLIAEGLTNLYPGGEGAGYAGGITSAAMDGIRIAEKIAERYAPIE